MTIAREPSYVRFLTNLARQWRVSLTYAGRPERKASELNSALDRRRVVSATLLPFSGVGPRLSRPAA